MPEPPLLQLVIFLYIIRVLGAHNPVPYTEIQPIIPAELFMMQVVMNRGVHYFKPPAMPELPRHQLIPEVAVYINDKT